MPSFPAENSTCRPGSGWPATSRHVTSRLVHATDATGAEPASMPGDSGPHRTLISAVRWCLRAAGDRPPAGIEELRPALQAGSVGIERIAVRAGHGLPGVDAVADVGALGRGGAEVVRNVPALHG